MIDFISDYLWIIIWIVITPIIIFLYLVYQLHKILDRIEWEVEEDVL